MLAMKKMNKTLAEFNSYLSESFFKKIHLIEKIIGNKHWLTSGTFKEKILINFLNQTLPKRMIAKSGFVVFPCKKDFVGKKPPESYDALNSSAYDISKQIDILIYDQLDFSPILNDDDILIIGPESVRAVIEVKGTLSHKHLQEAIKSLNDFSQKWTQYASFRKNIHLASTLPIPKMHLFCWEVYKNKNNKISIRPKFVRDALSKNLSKMTNPSNYENIPIINKVLVYNEYQTDFLHYYHEKKNNCSIGYLTLRGKYVIFDKAGTPQESGDKTIHSLLRDILVSNDKLFNRLLFDPDETGRIDILPPLGSGYSKAYDIKTVTRRVK